MGRFWTGLVMLEKYYILFKISSTFFWTSALNPRIFAVPFKGN